MILRCERHGVELEIGERAGIGRHFIRMPMVGPQRAWFAAWHSPDQSAPLPVVGPDDVGYDGLHGCALLTATDPKPGDCHAFDPGRRMTAARPCRVVEVT